MVDIEMSVPNLGSRMLTPNLYAGGSNFVFLMGALAPETPNYSKQLLETVQHTMLNGHKNGQNMLQRSRFHKRRQTELRKPTNTCRSKGSRFLATDVLDRS